MGRTKRLSLDSFISKRSAPGKGGRSPPGKGGGGDGASDGEGGPTYQLATEKEVLRAALQVLRVHRGVVPTQHELWLRVSEELRRDEPPRRTGPVRMRSILATSRRLRLEVRYAERGDGKPLLHCPVCFHEIKPRQNETLWGEQVTVGYRCTACPFWTPLKRRVPAQYTFRVETFGR